MSIARTTTVSGSTYYISDLGTIPPFYTPAPTCVTPYLDLTATPTSLHTAELLPNFHGSCSLSARAPGYTAYPQLDAACFPAGYVDATTALGTMLHFEGSACPTGYSAACTASKSADGLVGGAVRFAPFLNVNEQLAVCCPTGFACDAGADPGGMFQCTLSIPSTPTTAVATYLTTSCATATSTITLGPAQTHTLFTGTAMALNLITVPQSLLGTTQPTGTALNDTANALPTPSPNSNNLASPASGLSTGSKIALGIAVPLAVLALVILVFALVRRHRRRARERVASDSESAREKPELDAHGDLQVDRSVRVQHPGRPVELDGGSRAAEMHTGANGVELDSRAVIGELE